ncbi:MAG: hypothetical protein PF495_11750 [Spirochaetales bacterium]|jgi:hypothetical protein|nr:hypothetical protein [Spirochaetales bacterium]
MENRLIYLAGPIDLDETDEKKKWRQWASKELNELGFSTFSPVGAFSWRPGCGSESTIREVNWSALHASAAVLCYLPKGVQTIGTIMEIFKCMQTGKSLYLCTDIKNAIYLHGIETFKTVQDAVDSLGADFSTK